MSDSGRVSVSMGAGRACHSFVHVMYSCMLFVELLETGMENRRCFEQTDAGRNLHNELDVDVHGF